MKFLVPNYSCLQNPWLGSYRSQIPVLSVLCPQLNLLNPPRKKFLGTPLTGRIMLEQTSNTLAGKMWNKCSSLARGLKCFWNHRSACLKFFISKWYISSGSTKTCQLYHKAFYFFIPTQTLASVFITSKLRKESLHNITTAHDILLL